MTNEEIKAFAKEHHNEMVEKGFWKDKSMVKKALLIVGELGEALEAHRKGKRCSIAIGVFHNKNFENELISAKFEKDVKDTFEDEISDTMLRLLDFCVYFDKLLVRIDNGGYQFEYAKKEIERQKADLKNWTDNSASDLDLYLIIAQKAILDFVTEVPFICLLEIAKHMNFDLWAHVIAKRKYNKTRAYLFGKKY